MAKTIRSMTQRNAVERWETQISNSEATPHAIWPLVKSVMKRDRPKAPTAIHGSSGFKFLALKKANAIADCLENRFTAHDLCEENRERRVEARVQALSETVRPCDVQKPINSLSN
jgi:hypothetical protein